MRNIQKRTTKTGPDDAGLNLLLTEARMDERKDRALAVSGNDSNLLIVFYVQIMPDDFVMQLHRF
ncbi:DUF2732 family protein [Escherichia coli]|nr:DUF2732 family protein [Escherichia coli]